MQMCPCCSQLPYLECCKIYHDGTNAPTSLALMRSRYSAYALEKADYIIETTDPESIYYEKNREKWRAALLKFSRETTFDRLEILSHGEDWVHFIAYLKQQGKEILLNEKSQFRLKNGKWLYLSALISN